MDHPSGKKVIWKRERQEERLKEQSNFSTTYKAMLLIWILCCQLLLNFQNLSNNLIPKITIMIEDILHINSNSTM